MQVRVRVSDSVRGVTLLCESDGELHSFTADEIATLCVHAQLGHQKRAACIVEHLRCGSNYVKEPQIYVVDFDGREAIAVRRTS